MSMDIDAAIDSVKAIYRDQSLSKVQKKIQAAPILSALSKEQARLGSELEETRRELSHSERLVAALEDMEASFGCLLESAEGNVIKFSQGTVELDDKNNVSRVHRLADALRTGALLLPAGEKRTLEAMPEGLQTFVITHDWPAIVGDQEGEFILPFEACAFEYRVSGRTVIVLAGQEEGSPALGSVFYESKAGDWLFLGALEGTSWMHHVRAVCIVLDAEVAAHEVHRAPHKLNAKRIKDGRAPLLDFRTVDLTKRERASRLRSDGAPSHHKRLHFRRGHWRHFEKSKTWVRWCLAGDAALGVVFKEYRA